jgi:hypothetical protein
MKDALGNTIRDGDLLAWNITEDLRNSLVFQVIKVQDGGLSTPRGDTPGLLILGISLPIAKPKENLTDFKCLRNPESEARLDAIIGEGAKPS